MPLDQGVVAVGVEAKGGVVVILRASVGDCVHVI
jgi:hypothetical protein